MAVVSLTYSLNRGLLLYLEAQRRPTNTYWASHTWLQKCITRWDWWGICL